MKDSAIPRLTLVLGAVISLSGMGTALAAGLPSTEADEITLNVPVRLTSLPTEVKKGRIECDVHLNWNAGGPDPRGTGMATGRHFTEARGATEFPIDPNAGNFSGNVAVKVKTGPPRAAVDFEEPLRLLDGTYSCWLSLASDTGDFYPGPPQHDAATGQATGRRGAAPSWAQAQGNARLEVTGRIQAPPPRAAGEPAQPAGQMKAPAR